MQLLGVRAIEGPNCQGSVIVDGPDGSDAQLIEAVQIDMRRAFERYLRDYVTTITRHHGEEYRHRTMSWPSYCVVELTGGATISYFTRLIGPYLSDEADWGDVIDLNGAIAMFHHRLQEEFISILEKYGFELQATPAIQPAPEADTELPQVPRRLRPPVSFTDTDWDPNVTDEGPIGLSALVGLRPWFGSGAPAQGRVLPSGPTAEEWAAFKRSLGDA
jgi:hypothetical protein